MEIIKHGDPELIAKKKDPRKLFQCRYCGCMFKCGKDNYHQGFNRNEEWCQAKCPECEGVADEVSAS